MATIETSVEARLTIACTHGYVKTVVAILRHRQDLLNARIGENGETPIILAAREGQEDVVRLLLSYNPDLTRAAERGVTALHVSAVRGYGGVVSALLDAGAVIDAKSDMGQTALISASEMSRVSVVKELLLRGADHTTIDASGKSALAYANASENDALMELLNDARAAEMSLLDSMPRLSLTDEDCAQLASVLESSPARPHSLRQQGKLPESPGSFGRMLAGSFDLLSGSSVMEAPSDSDMGFTPTVRHSNIEDDSLLPPLTIPPTAVRDEPTRPPVDKSMPATSQLPTQSRSQNRAALRNSPKQQLLVAPAADGLQGVIDSGKCIVCESKPAACFFNKTSAGHTEESVRALLSSLLPSDGIPPSCLPSLAIMMPGKTDEVSVGDCLRSDPRYRQEYGRIDFEAVPEGVRVLCDRCRSNLRHRAKAVLGHRKRRSGKRRKPVNSGGGGGGGVGEEEEDIAPDEQEEEDGLRRIPSGPKLGSLGVPRAAASRSKRLGSDPSVLPAPPPAASSAAPRPSGVGGFFQSLTGMLHSQFFGGSFDGLGEEDWFTAMDGDTTGDTATDGAAAHGTERPSSTNMFEY